MTTRSWIRNLFARKRPIARKAPARYRLLLETLERRLAPAAITVTSPANALHYNPSATVTDLTNHTNLVNGNSEPTITLRDAINAANNTGGSNTIVLSNTTYDFTTVDNYWYGPNALPVISSTLTITGNGATLQRDGSLPNTAAGGLRFFYISGGLSGLPAGNLTLNNLTLQGGNSAQGGGNVGGTVHGAKFSTQVAAQPELSGAGVAENPGNRAVKAAGAPTRTAPPTSKKTLDSATLRTRVKKFGRETVPQRGPLWFEKSWRSFAPVLGLRDEAV